MTYYEFKVYEDHDNIPIVLTVNGSRRGRVLFYQRGIDESYSAEWEGYKVLKLLNREFHKWTYWFYNPHTKLWSSPSEALLTIVSL